MTIDELKRALDAVWVDDERVCPEVLYHYTSAEGLKGIIEQRAILATHAAFTNDSRELQHALPVIQAAFESCRGLGSEMGDALIEAVLAESVRVERDFEIYIACFSEDGDSLSQWRAYADDGQGYALGLERDFDGKAHPACCGNFGGYAIDLLPMVYDDDEIQKDLCGHTKAVIELMEGAAGSTDRDAALSLAKARLMARAARASTRLKHPGFRAEREWRLTILSKTEDDPLWWTPRKGLLSSEIRQCSRENHDPIHSRRTRYAA